MEANASAFAKQLHFAPMSTEFGIVMEASPGYTARLAGDIEAMGFDVLLCPDTQNLSPDPFSQLALATQTTRRLRLGTGVTNPVTRDVAVTACAFSLLMLLVIRLFVLAVMPGYSALNFGMELSKAT